MDFLIPSLVKWQCSSLCNGKIWNRMTIRLSDSLHHKGASISSLSVASSGQPAYAPAWRLRAFTDVCDRPHLSPSLLLVATITHSVHFNGPFFQVDLCLLDVTLMSSFWILWELKMIRVGGDNWSYKVCKTPSHIVTTNKPTSCSFTGEIPFLSPNQQC